MAADTGWSAMFGMCRVAAHFSSWILVCGSASASFMMPSVLVPKLPFSKARPRKLLAKLPNEACGGVHGRPVSVAADAGRTAPFTCLIWQVCGMATHSSDVSVALPSSPFASAAPPCGPRSLSRKLPNRARDGRGATSVSGC